MGAPLHLQGRVPQGWWFHYHRAVLTYAAINCTGIYPSEIDGQQKNRFRAPELYRALRFTAKPTLQSSKGCIFTIERRPSGLPLSINLPIATEIVAVQDWFLHGIYFYRLHGENILAK